MPTKMQSRLRFHFVSNPHPDLLLGSGESSVLLDLTPTISSKNTNQLLRLLATSMAHQSVLFPKSCVLIVPTLNVQIFPWFLPDDLPCALTESNIAMFSRSWIYWRKMTTQAPLVPGRQNYRIETKHPAPLMDRNNNNNNSQIPQFQCLMSK